MPQPPAAQPLGSKAPPPRQRRAYREITWDELVPKDWDPTKDLKDMNFGPVRDGDPRAAAMLKRMREPGTTRRPTRGRRRLSRIPGYVVPLEESKAGLTEFLLVPYFGACIHTPPPPSNQIIHVKPRQPPKGFRSMDTVWVSGTLEDDALRHRDGREQLPASRPSASSPTWKTEAAQGALHRRMRHAACRSYVKPSHSSLAPVKNMPA